MAFPSTTTSSSTSSSTSSRTEVCSCSSRGGLLLARPPQCNTRNCNIINNSSGVVVVRVSSECSSILLASSSRPATPAPAPWATRVGSLLDSRPVSAGSGAPRQLSPKLGVLTGIGVHGFGPVAGGSVWCLAAAATSSAARDAPAALCHYRERPCSWGAGPFKGRIPWTGRGLPESSSSSSSSRSSECSEFREEKEQLGGGAMGGGGSGGGGGGGWERRMMPGRRWQRGLAAAGEENAVVRGVKRALLSFFFGIALALAGPAAAAPTSGGASASVGAAGLSTLMHDLLAGAVTSLGAVAYIELFSVMAKRDVMSKMLSRKLVHIGVGLIFMLFWPLYSTSPVAPLIAAVAPGANCLRIAAVGLGLLRDDNLVKSMTRQGNRKELLRGPFFYGVSVVVATIYFWRTSAVGVVTLVTMCAGDGIADITGRRFGKTKLPYNKNKSVAGSISFFLVSSAISVIYLGIYAAFGFLELREGTMSRILLICFLSAVMESTPLTLTIDDNLLVPFTSAALGMLLLPSQ